MACQSLHEPTSQPPSPSLITPGELISYPHPTPQGFFPCSPSSSRCLHGSLLLNKIFSLEPLKTAAIAPSLHTLPCLPSLFSLACIPSDIGCVTVGSMRAVSWCAVANSASPGHPIPDTRYVHESVHIAYIYNLVCAITNSIPKGVNLPYYIAPGAQGSRDNAASSCDTVHASHSS